MNARKPSDPLDDDTRPVPSQDPVNVYAPESDAFSPEDYAVGQVISGRFRVEHVIGIGSMGIVLAARHIELDERVAIKFIRSEMQAVPGVLSRFAREAKAAASIKSEHIAQVFDVGTADGIGPYIVMEYLEGRDLAALLELEGRLSIRRAVHYVMQACEALAVAHSAGITHRDIKPENLFLTHQGELERIKLLDFGISKSALTGRVFGDELSNADNACLLGTPLYMSPEQIRADVEIDHRTDIWALGAVLYELVTARSAFVADSVRQVWTRILETSPTALVAYCPEAPPTLQAVIERCLEKDPARRFQNVAELAAALLPFAPSGARVYAQRTSSILGWSPGSSPRSDSSLPGATPSSAPPRAPSPLPVPLGFQRPREPSTAAPSASGAYLALPLADISAPPVFGRRSSLGAAEPGRRQRVAAMLVAGLLGASLLVWFGSRRVEPSASRADAAGRPWPGETPAAAPQPEELSSSRAVLIESQPSGALVSVGGQPIGVTPLSTLLPVGVQQLGITKPGYATEQAFVQLDAAPHGAKAVRTRVVLKAAPSDATPAAAQPAPAGASPPRPAPLDAARTAPRRAPPRRAPARRAEAGRDDPPASSAAPALELVPAEPAPALVEAPPRARLLDEPPRARLLD